LTSTSKETPEYKGPKATNTVLVVDDEEIVCVVLEEALSAHFAIALVKSAEEAVTYFVNAPPDVLLVDKNLPGMSGIDLLRQSKELNPDCEVVVITGYASLESAIEALRLGAYDYLMKPFDDIEIVLEKVRKAGEKHDLSSERRQLMDQIIASNHELRDAHDRLSRAYLQTLTSMITALEARDAYTRGHSDRVAEFSEMIAVEMGVKGEELKHLVDAARLHDIGKIGIREQVLNKAGKLTDEEYDHIKKHPEIGAQIIGQMEAYAHLVPMVRHHHERWDGNGYPVGIKGEEIPFGARIIAVADTFDAMTSERSYRKPRSPGDAIRIIREVAGSQLDPATVGAFLIVQARMQKEAV